MNDAIHIKGLTFFARHGVFAAERELGQKFIIHLTAYMDFSLIGKSDSIEDGVCYKSMIEHITNYAKENIFNTLEGLSESLAQSLLNSFIKISSVDLTIEKPNAAIDAIFDTICVQVKRSR